MRDPVDKDKNLSTAGLAPGMGRGGLNPPK